MASVKTTMPNGTVVTVELPPHIPAGTQPTWAEVVEIVGAKEPDLPPGTMLKTEAEKRGLEWTKTGFWAVWEPPKR